MQTALNVYGIIAVFLFAVLILFGKVFQKLSLGNGVALGILNSFILSALWPITLICSIVGLVYEGIKLWKRL